MASSTFLDNPNVTFANVKMKRFRYLLFVGVILLSSCKHEIPIDMTGTISENCDPDTVYFGNTILPLLLSNCAMSGCHNSGELNLTSYASLMNSGIVKPGRPNTSKLVRVINGGGEEAMPPSPYSALTTVQINSIKTWIDQGAKFNTCVECDTLNYRFAADIWPILSTNCSGCHNNSNPGGNIYIRNYTDVQSMVNDGSLMGSLLGDGYQIMPKNTNGLQSCKITQIQKWINDGAQNN
jgi:hypothetical protein